jgi:predicted RNA-binding Zn ribbon-like protein
MPENNDWRSGFIFVGNQLALDFLNTRPVIDGHPVEFFQDSQAILRWLIASGLLVKRPADWKYGDVGTLLHFRETLRQAVIEIEAGKTVSPSFVRQVNELLAMHPFIDRIGADGKRHRQFQPNGPADALGPILDATVDLLTILDPVKIRKCDQCVLHFYDSSKKGGRRWCSMRMCGNRFKVAAYARRKKPR